MVGEVDREGLGMTTYDIIINREVRRASVYIVYRVRCYGCAAQAEGKPRVEEGINPEHRNKPVDG